MTSLAIDFNPGRTHAAGGDRLGPRRCAAPRRRFAYLLTALKTVMIYGGILRPGDMEKGQLRCDAANISSIRPVGQAALGTKVELKNLNSISFVRDGIALEIKRQVAVVQSGGTITQETRDYDGQTGASRSLRSKEMAHDYRYFPDPDLMPVQVGREWREQVQATCPELPFDRQRRLQKDYEVPYTITSVLISRIARAVRFSSRSGRAPERQAASGGQLDRERPAARTRLLQTGAFAIEGEACARRGPCSLVDEGPPSSATPPRRCSSTCSRRARCPADVVGARKGLAAETNPDELERWCREAIAANPKSVADFKGGKDSAINAFKGPVMKAGRGKVDPKRVDETLRRLLAG